MNNSGSLRRILLPTAASFVATQFSDTSFCFESSNSAHTPSVARTCASRKGVSNGNNLSEQIHPKQANTIFATSATSGPGTKILFLGSGSSTGCPKPICSLIFPPKSVPGSKDPKLIALQKEMEKKCTVSKLASVGDPKTNRNYRNNPSLLISHRNNDDGMFKSESGATYDSVPLRNVIIDVGKTFREGAIRWMPSHGIYNVDAIVLTHEHMDAIGGLDDLRGFQNVIAKLNSNKIMEPLKEALPVFLSSQCFEAIKKQFHYLVPNNETSIEKKGSVEVIRAVAALRYNIIDHFQPFIAAGLKMIPLPVMHGEDLICNGYAFSVKGENGNDTNVVYLSDISRMIPETEKFISEKLPPTDILVVDSLLMNRKHPVHYNLDQALELMERIGPKKTFIVGINCDDFPEHDQMNKLLKKRNLSVQLAHDGLVLQV